MTRALVFDPFAGAAGDMTLGALIDLGLEPDWLRTFITSLELGEIGVNIERVNRRGINCGRVYFDIPEQKAHRHLRHILEIVEKAPLSDLTRTRAIAAFRRLGAAEAEVHGTTMEKVHFHEVGAIDAILDVVCTMAAVEKLGFETFYTRPVAVGSGSIDIDHGRYPVPAPATLKILEGLPLTGFELEGECTTPTGATLIATLTGGKTPPSQLRVQKSGYGAGTWNPEGRPNALRLIACEVGPTADLVYVLQADLDDMRPEDVPAALQAALDAGALDASAQPLAMKKGRPGLRLEALVTAGELSAVSEAVLRHTTTLGVRYWPVQRSVLERSEERVEWRGQQIRVKTAMLPDGQTRTKPEYEDVAAAAQAAGVPIPQARAEIEALQRHK